VRRARILTSFSMRKSLPSLGTASMILKRLGQMYVSRSFLYCSHVSPRMSGRATVCLWNVLRMAVIILSPCPAEVTSTTHATAR